MDHASRGAAALAAKDFPSAITHYTTALSQSPRAPAYYINRSIAYTRLNSAQEGPKLDLALQDAEIAVALAVQRGRREVLIEAQMRRGIVLFNLGRYADALFVLEKVKGMVGAGKKDEEDSGAGNAADVLKKASGGKQAGHTELLMWEMKARRKFEALEDGDKAKIVSVEDIPKVGSLDEDVLLKRVKEGAQNTAEAAKQETISKTTTPASASSTTSTAAAAAPAKPRHEWYQNNDSVCLTIYAKGVDKTKAKFDFAETSVSATIEFPPKSGTELNYTFSPLCSSIDPDASKASVFGTKIEFVLKKKVPGERWANLEGKAGEISTTTATPNAITTPAPVTTASAPVYPTSSKSGPKDWDKVAKEELKRAKPPPAPKDTTSSESKPITTETSEDAEQDDFDDESSDPVDAFFKRLYAKADPDTRRAMMKSYTESQGTALSTNWGEVGKETVKVHPPGESDD